MVDARAVISSALEELDAEYAAYQGLHCRYHSCEDEVAKTVHKRLVELCKRLLRDMAKE
jgi:uncharacterized protein (DUF1810 family)